MTSTDLKSILFQGGDIVINADQFPVFEIRSMAFTAKGHGGHIYIKSASKLTVLDCKAIAFSGGRGTVTFDFSEK